MSKKKKPTARRKRKKPAKPRHHFGELKCPPDVQIKDTGLVIGEEEEWGEDDGFEEQGLTERAKDG